MRLLATATALVAAVLALMLSILARAQLDDDRVAAVLGTLGVVGVVATLAVETWAARR